MHWTWFKKRGNANADSNDGIAKSNTLCVLGLSRLATAAAREGSARGAGDLGPQRRLQFEQPRGVTLARLSLVPATPTSHIRDWWRRSRRCQNLLYSPQNEYRLLKKINLYYMDRCTLCLYKIHTRMRENHAFFSLEQKVLQITDYSCVREPYFFEYESATY